MYDILATIKYSSSIFSLEMAVKTTAVIYLFNPVNLNSQSDPRPPSQLQLCSLNRTTGPFSSSSTVIGVVCSKLRFFIHPRIPPPLKLRSARTALPMFSENPVVGDVVATALTGGIALSLLRFWGEIAKMGLFDQDMIENKMSR